MSLEYSYKKILKKMQDACIKSNREFLDITFIAVSKTRSEEEINKALSLGITHFGENRVQELLKKQSNLQKPLIKWHLIGNLQRNKVRKIVGNCNSIHSVNSLLLAQKINEIAKEKNIQQKILLQVNIAEEKRKSGFTTESLKESFSKIQKLSSLIVEGLMIIPPFSNTPEDSRPLYQQLFLLKKFLEKKHNTSLPHLSMGMSNDYAVAIEEGSTMVRVGRAFFGER